MLYNLREVAKRVKGKRSRGVGNKTSIFILTTLPTKNNNSGILKRDSKNLYAKLVKNASAKNVLMVANTHNNETFQT